MLKLKLNCVLLFLVFHVSNSQRRIKDGEVVEEGRSYVVYLLKASISPQYYDSWVCGGALVSPKFIVTSAACVTDVQHLYAIAGYSKYVTDEEIHNDPCTSKKKKKIILICTPKAYELKYEELEKWSYIDIAVVEVESPYDLEDETYASICSYTPVPIPINYEAKFQEADIDAIVFGWGHHDKWREAGDVANYNQENLNYAPTLIQDKEECKKQYEVYNGMAEVIDRYMLCTFETGNINALGETIIKTPPTAQGCVNQPKKLKGYEGVSCETANKPGEEIVLIENARKNMKPSNETLKIANKKLNYTLSNKMYRNLVNNMTQNNSSLDKLHQNFNNSNRRTGTRRHGICQNDHGGPLVTWIGSHEVLIGVASVFKITEESDCIGPYLFASTQCSGAFLDCILRSDPAKTDRIRRAICDSPASIKGFELIERHISWKDHPDGPADNERNTTSVNNTTANQTNTQEDKTRVEEQLNITTKLGNTLIINANISTTSADQVNSKNLTKVTTKAGHETKTTGSLLTTTARIINLIKNTASANQPHSTTNIKTNTPKDKTKDEEHLNITTKLVNTLILNDNVSTTSADQINSNNQTKITTTGHETKTTGSTTTTTARMVNLIKNTSMHLTNSTTNTTNLISATNNTTPNLVTS